MWVAPKGQRLQTFGRPMLQTTSIQGCTHGSRVTRVWPATCCCEDTHCENRLIRGCTHESRLQRFCPTNCCFEHTHVRRSMCHFRVAPKSQELQCSGRPAAAASIHMCIAERSGLHPGVEILPGLGRPTAAVSIHMCVAE